MPELPEVEITRRKLIEQGLIGAKISSFWSDWPRGLQIAKSVKLVNSDIASRKILNIRRLGKALFFDLSKNGSKWNKWEEVDKVLGWHFRMSGRLEVRSERLDVGDWRRTDDKSIHARVTLNDGREIIFRDPRKFGVVWYGTPEELNKDSYIGTLGPDMLFVKFAEFKKQLQNKNGMIKPVLLDQKVVAGIGNIIVDESLWHARVHPKILSYVLPDQAIRTIYSSLKLVIKRILKARGSTMRDWSHPDGEAGGYEKIRWIYGREGENCPRCRNIIKRIVVGSRGTSICEKCQKL